MEVIELDNPVQGIDVEELAQLHHEEYGSGREFDVKAVARACADCCSVAERKHLNCWVAYDDDGPVGYLAGTIHRSFYSFRSYAVQEMWYVTPRARGTKAAQALIEAFELWARANNCERVYTQVEHDNNQTLVEFIFMYLRKLGYKKQGYVAVKILDSTNTKDKEHNDDRTSHRELGA